ncbi:MAG: metal-dependent hydrolase [Saprospiraceae bacterium]
MDSLSQIVLGAAVGEAILGKKVGNRAMVWGAIAGTIPDLDVLANAFMTPIDALAFHRGATHSFLFCIIGALVLGWAVHGLYRWPHHKLVGVMAWSILTGGIGLLIFFLGEISTSKIIIGILWFALAGWIIFRRYYRPSYDTPIATIKAWQWMFFGALITHPILDCFTTYGTQILLPLSDQRVAFNNISVVDPLYTIPFLICLIAAGTIKYTDPRRRWWNNAGLIVSSVYMIFTIFNKVNINVIFESSMADHHIVANRYMTTPTILNNVLWSGIAETDSAYYFGNYSYFDIDDRFKLQKIKKTEHQFAEPLSNDRTLKILRWFSDDYFLLQPTTKDTLEYMDLRFGTFRMRRTDPDEFVFKFNILQQPQGTFILLDQGNSPRNANFGEAFAVLWERILGKL